MAYLNNLSEVKAAKCPSNDRTADLAVIDEAWACIAAHCVEKATQEYANHRKSGKPKEVAYELCSQERFIASKVHSTGYIFRNFRLAVDEIAKTEDPSNGVTDILQKVCQLYGLWSVDENAAFFLKYRYYSAEQMDIISAKVTALCLEIRKSAVNIVDAFAFSDVSNPHREKETVG